MWLSRETRPLKHCCPEEHTLCARLLCRLLHATCKAHLPHYKLQTQDSHTQPCRWSLVAGRRARWGPLWTVLPVKSQEFRKQYSVHCWYVPRGDSGDVPPETHKALPFADLRETRICGEKAAAEGRRPIADSSSSSSSSRAEPAIQGGHGVRVPVPLVNSSNHEVLYGLVSGAFHNNRSPWGDGCFRCCVWGGAATTIAVGSG